MQGEQFNFCSTLFEGMLAFTSFSATEISVKGNELGGSFALEFNGKSAELPFDSSVTQFKNVLEKQLQTGMEHPPCLDETRSSDTQGRGLQQATTPLYAAKWCRVERRATSLLLRLQ